MSDFDADPIRERLTRLAVALADQMAAHASQGRSISAPLQGIDSRLDRIERRLGLVEP